MTNHAESTLNTAQGALTEFLEARIVEDEAAARRAIDFPYSIRSTPWGGTFEIVPDSLDSRADHWLCVDPARVLAECEAKRRIVERCGSEVRQQELNPRRETFDTAERYILRSLAAVYADHPDYREEWRP